jgi:hypothetical protein
MLVNENSRISASSSNLPTYCSSAYSRLIVDRASKSQSLQGIVRVKGRFVVQERIYGIGE